MRPEPSGCEETGCESRGERKDVKIAFGREIKIHRRLTAGGTTLRRRFVGARCDKVIGLTAVDAEPFVSTTILFLGGERAAAY